MNKAFDFFLWQNGPSIETPMGETLLNKVNNAVNEIDNRVVNFDTTKANQADMLTAIISVSFDKDTGTFTFTKKNGATEKVDTLLEKLAVNFSYDEQTQRLVITNSDGTIQYVDMKALITELEFLNSNVVLFSVTDGKVSASIAKGSITGDMLDPSYLASMQLYVSQALSYANQAEGYMVAAYTHATNAENSAERAEAAAKEAGANAYTHPSSGVVAGTYRSVTVDEKGHVINGENPIAEIEHGGTGATTAEEARTNLGLGAAATCSLEDATMSYSKTAVPSSSIVKMALDGKLNTSGGNVSGSLSISRDLNVNGTIKSSGKEVHDTGNKPTGSYTGNGDATARNINTGGIGNAIMLWMNNGTIFVGPSGGVGNFYNSEHMIFSKNELKFESGILTIATSNLDVNADGFTVNYQVL